MDKKKIILSAVIILLIIITVVILVKTRTQAIIKVNPAFREYVSAYTSGVISTESTIKVRLNADIADSSMFENAIDEELFDISPSLKGKAYWIDTRTVEFRPDERMPSNTLFTVKFNLYKLMVVPDSMRIFTFQFHTTRQAFEAKVSDIKTYNPQNFEWVKVSGTLVTADYAETEDVQKMITATQDGRSLNIKITQGANTQTFLFTIDSVRRTEKQGLLEITYDGKPIGVKEKSKENISIPSVNDFLVTSVNTFTEPETYVSIKFSDPLLEEQDLQGMVKIGAATDLKFIIDDNEIRVYPPSEETGNVLLYVDASVKNIKGKELGKIYTDTITFEDVKPDIKLLGEGVILPGTNGLMFPFEAINLKAVDVKIFKIYENNISQFLQVNDLKGDRELSRVGKVIYYKNVPLQSLSAPVLNYKKWNRFYLDLSELIAAEPGAIYKVTLSIKKAYSLYQNCDTEEDTETPDDNMVTFDQTTEDEEPDNWYYYDDYGYYYDDYDYYYYDWYERDDPCEDSYYRSKTVSRSVLATDIGLITKIGTDGSLEIYATNLITAQPMAEVSLKILNYQNQELHKDVTNSEGRASFQLSKVPFLIIAQKGSQKCYLRLTGGSALSLSMFDVSGESVRKGIKGFMYAERGVWRPGDSIYLTFILEDKLNKLSPNTPVIFKLTNPRGQKIQQFVTTKSLNGFYDLRTATDPNAITGYYTASVQVGGSYFSKTLRVETIKPNRLKIILDFAADKITSQSKGTLNVRWLHGAIARNLKADITLTLNRATAAFPKYSNYIFDDPSVRFYSETYKIFEGNLDNEGKADVFPDINIGSNAPGVLKANFQTRVFEQGGAFSIDQKSWLYYPYNSYAGVLAPEGQGWSDMLYTNKTHAFLLANLDMNGKPITTGNLKVDVYKVGWRWWWDNSGNDLADFVRSTYNEPYKSFTSKISQGRGQFTLNIPDGDWGRYFIRITDTISGHSCGKVIYFDWPSWASRSREGKEAANMLIFSADKEKYEVGEEVKLTIPSGAGARALITIETGTKVLESYWVDTEKDQTIFTFKVKEEMAPNVYISVTMIQPHSQTANDLPIRLYGVIPVLVEDPNTHLRPIINMPEVLRPEENASITIKEENGKAMTYTLAVVDEGLLDLTGFKTPDPWNYFYAREALGVKTWDIYDYVLGAYGGQLERILSIGGGDDGGDGNGTNRANRFKPMVKFFGPFALKKGSSNTYTFKMPQYVGSVRVMVIAGQDGAYGNAEKTVQVKKPLMLLATLPRVLGPGETVSLPVSVFAMEKYVKNATVKVTANEMFSIEGTASKTVSFNAPGDELVTFNLKVKDITGVGKVKVVANSGKEYAACEIEIEIRNPNPELTDVLSEVIRPGSNWNTDFLPVGIAGTNKGVIEVSSIPPIDLTKRMKYLISYPYGCVEQTVSSVFPQLYLGDLKELDENTQKTIDRNIKAGIKRITGFQAPSGGLSYWPGLSETDEWSSTYAGHFMLEAKAKGYTISTVFLKKWIKYQKAKARAWVPNYSKYYYNYDLLQAYRLYSLALAGEAEMGAMNLLKEQANLTHPARLRLAAAYQLSGQPAIAKKLVEGATLTVKPYREMAYTYGDEFRDMAMIIETLSLLDMRTKAAPIVKTVSARLSSGSWMSTQTTAFCLLAISKFADHASAASGIDFSYTIDKNAAVNVKSAKPVVSIDLKLLNSVKKGKLKIINNSKNILYARLVLSGIPAPGNEKAADNNLKITVAYQSLSGAKLNPEKLEQGSDFIAEVSITNPGLMGFYYNMALSHIFPSGWEIHNTRMDDSYGRIQMSPYDYQDIRDDRVNTFFSIGSNTVKNYKVLLNASYLGRFYLPAILCDAMYDDNIYARTQGTWVEVVPYQAVTAK